MSLPIVCSVAMCAIANEEMRLTGFRLDNWDEMRETGWYCFGTFVGESITRDTRSSKALALRLVAHELHF